MKKVLSLFFISFLFVTPVFAQSPFGGPPQNPQDPGGPTNTGGYIAPGNSAVLNNPTNPGNPTNTGPSATLDNPTNPGAVTSAGTGLDSGTGLGAGTSLDAGGGIGVGSPTSVGSGLLPTSQNAGGVIGVGEPTDPGYVLYGGNGGQAYNFWDYLKSLFSLKGQDNQSTYKNQETVDQKIEPVKYTELTTPSELPKTLGTSTPKTGFACKTDTSNKTLGGYINLATCVLLYLIPIIISAMVLWFMFGAVKVLNDNEHETRNQYKQFLTWGVLIIFVALCFVGILRVLSTTLGL